MEQTNNNYPKFEKGQVLTSQALNSYFGYLDEQQRLTRAKLLGVGIIDGLEYEHYGNKLIIKKGTAVTADGYLIDLPEDTTYTVAYEYNPNSTVIAKRNPLDEKDDDFKNVLQHVKYILYKDENDATLHNLLPNKKISFPKPGVSYIISLMVDFISQDNITKCSELSCDIVQSNYQIEIRPVLIAKDILDEDTVSVSTIDVANRLFHSINFHITIQTVLNIDSTYNPLSGNNFYNYLKKAVNYVITNYLEKYTTEGIINLILKNKFIDLSKATERFKNLSEHLNVIKEKSGNIPSYYLNHLILLEKGVEEFFDYYYSFANKYGIIPIGKKAFKRLIMLGSMKKIWGKIEPEPDNDFRQINDNILKDPQFITDCSLLEKAFNRIFLLAESFNFNYQSESSFCYCQQSNARLKGQRKPDYYNLTQNDWQLFPGYYPSDYNSSIEPTDFLAVENYYGVKKSTLRHDLLVFSNIYHFPFTIEYIPVGSLNAIIDKYKTKYSKELLSEALLCINNITYYYSEVDPEKNPYGLDHDTYTILSTIDNHKDFYPKDAKELVDKILGIKKEFAAFGKSGLFAIFENYYHNRELNNDIYSKGINRIIIDLYKNVAKESDLLQVKCTDSEKIKLDYFRNSIWDNYNLSLEASNFDNNDTMLSYCLEYLYYFAKCEPNYINKCPYDGKLTVFYTNDNEEKVLLVVGSNKAE